MNTDVTVELTTSTIDVSIPETVTSVTVAGVSGVKGDTGPAGPSNTLSIGTVSTVPAGGSATASITGTSPTQTLNLGLPTGATGATGTDGKTLRNGTGAPSSGLGVDGDFYLDTAASRLYGPKTSGSWGTGVSIIGATGTAATVAVNSTVTGAAGTSALVENLGTSAAASLKFTIPTGPTGISIAATAPSDTSILWADTTTTPNYTPVPAGGTTGQSLVKVSGSDYAIGWATPTIDPTQVTGTAVVTADARLSDTRTPTDGTVTNAKVASNAAIDVSKLSGVFASAAIAASLDLTSNTAETMSRRLALTAQVLTLGTVFFTNFSPLWSFNATSVTVNCTTAHTGTPTVVRAGFYSYDDTNGYTLLNASTHSAAILNGTGLRSFTIPSTALTAGNRYAVGIIIVGATATAQVSGVTGVSTITAGTTTGPALPRISGALASQTDLPSSVAYASIAAATSTQWSRIA